MALVAGRRRRPMSEINVVPYIDVMLVLLVIFMITAPLLNLGVEVDLPEANAEPLPLSEQETPVIVTVTETGGLYLNAAGDEAGLVSEESLVQQIAAFVRRNPDLQVLVGGDESVDYGLIYNAMVLLQQAGVSKVGLMSDPMESIQ